MTDSKGIAYKDGRYIPIEESFIHIMDPAFTKGDVVFDVVTVWDDNFFRLDDHLERFHSSCDYVRLSPPCTDDEIRHVLAQCVDRAGFSRAMVWMLCTRGPFSGGTAFGDPRFCENHFMAYSVPYFWIVPKERSETGAHIWIAETRRAPDVAINQRAKNYNRMDLTAAQFEALDAGADNPVLISTAGFITEGPGNNVWIIKNRTAFTPGENILEGVTRRTVFELCEEIGLKAETADLTPADLKNADEVFISTSGGGIVPVTRVSDQPIGNGAPGLTSCRLRDLYWEKRALGWHTTSVSELLAVPSDKIASAG